MSRMPIPPFKVFIHGTLREMSSGETLKNAEWAERVARLLNLSENDRGEILKTGSPVYLSRVQWSLSYLFQAGLVDRPARGTSRVTSAGQSFLSAHPRGLEMRDLKQIHSFKVFATPKGKMLPALNEADDDLGNDQISPEEQLEEAYLSLESTLREELLSQVQSITPKQFEHLIVRLLIAMGYAGSDPDAGQVLGGAGDGGIDGVIRQDPLGLDNVYVQAKRYTAGTVGAPDIQGFLGALSMKGVTKGVFITTSTFTSAASSSVNARLRPICRPPRPLKVLSEASHLPR
ncbi:MAG: restriction endonuclease [Alphaproteobacteria bacterium]|nr:MAG: restriction endonuclease [Alphaproteobacteria bacterium]